MEASRLFSQPILDEVSEAGIASIDETAVM
jgi:hypothetical protein